MIVLATEKVNCPFCQMPMHFYHEDIYRKYYNCLECGRKTTEKKEEKDEN